MYHYRSQKKVRCNGRTISKAEVLFKEFGLVKIKFSGNQLVAICKRGKQTPSQQVNATVSCACPSPSSPMVPLPSLALELSTVRTSLMSFKEPAATFQSRQCTTARWPRGLLEPSPKRLATRCRWQGRWCSERSQRQPRRRRTGEALKLLTSCRTQTSSADRTW